MDDKAIEAAAKAYYAEQSRRFGTHDHPPEILFEDPKETERAIFTAAIKAADAARAKQGFVVVRRDDLREVLSEYRNGWVRADGEWLVDEMEATYDRLTAALGDGERVTGGDAGR